MTGSSKKALLETVTICPVCWRARTPASEFSSLSRLPISTVLVLSGEMSITSPRTPPVDAGHLPYLLPHVYGYPDSTALVGDGPLHGLADSPRRKSLR